MLKLLLPSLCIWHQRRQQCYLTYTSLYRCDLGEQKRSFCHTYSSRVLSVKVRYRLCIQECLRLKIISGAGRSSVHQTQVDDKVPNDWNAFLLRSIYKTPFPGDSNNGVTMLFSFSMMTTSCYSLTEHCGLYQFDLLEKRLALETIGFWHGLKLGSQKKTDMSSNILSGSLRDNLIFFTKRWPVMRKCHLSGEKRYSLNCTELFIGS